MSQRENQLQQTLHLRSEWGLRERDRRDEDENVWKDRAEDNTLAQCNRYTLHIPLLPPLSTILGMKSALCTDEASTM